MATKKDLVAGKENLPADLSAFEGIPSGFENVTAKDLLIPRLTILQGLSPQVTPSKPEYDPDARVGQIYDVGLQQSFPDGIAIIPLFYAKAYLEWAPRKSGEGLKAIHDDPAILAQCRKEDDSSKMVLPNGNYISETAQFYVMNISADFRRSFLPMSSTQLKKAKRLLTLATSEKVKRGDGSEFTPPLFYRSYVLDAVMVSNAEGDWHLLRVSRAESLPELGAEHGPFPGLNWQGLRDDCVRFSESLRRGEARADTSSLAEEAEVSADATSDASRM